jgi:hypothetical protein
MENKPQTPLSKANNLIALMGRYVKSDEMSKELATLQCARVCSIFVIEQDKLHGSGAAFWKEVQYNIEEEILKLC